MWLRAVVPVGGGRPSGDVSGTRFPFRVGTNGDLFMIESSAVL